MAKYKMFYCGCWIKQHIILDVQYFKLFFVPLLTEFYTLHIETIELENYFGFGRYFLNSFFFFFFFFNTMIFVFINCSWSKMIYFKMNMSANLRKIKQYKNKNKKFKSSDVYGISHFHLIYFILKISWVANKRHLSRMPFKFFFYKSQ